MGSRDGHDASAFDTAVRRASAAEHARRGSDAGGGGGFYRFASREDKSPRAPRFGHYKPSFPRADDAANPHQ